MRQSKIYNFTDEQFQKIIEESNSLTEVCKKIGLSINGSNGRNQIKRRCIQLSIPLDHFGTIQKEWVSHAKYSIEEILIKDSKYTNRTAMKDRILKLNLLEYKCDICGNLGEWNGFPLSLQIDHINGINNDNRLENLRFLCPNCHSQTGTFSGKNKTNTQQSEESL